MKILWDCPSQKNLERIIDVEYPAPIFCELDITITLECKKNCGWKCEFNEKEFFELLKERLFK